MHTWAGWTIIVLACAPAVGAAQALQVNARQMLTFGDLFPGLPEQVLRTDPVRSGRFQIQGQRNVDIEIRFILPPSLIGPAATVLPVAFAPDDGGISAGNNPGNQIPFDPNLPHTFRIPGSGGPPRVQVSLGATASPAFNQSPGDYSAPIVLVVAYLGN